MFISLHYHSYFYICKQWLSYGLYRSGKAGKALAEREGRSDAAEEKGDLVHSPYQHAMTVCKKDYDWLYIMCQLPCLLSLYWCHNLAVQSDRQLNLTLKG